MWEPWTEAADFSLSQIWVVQDHDPTNLNTVEAGWIVSLNLFVIEAPNTFINNLNCV